MKNFTLILVMFFLNCLLSCKNEKQGKGDESEVRVIRVPVPDRKYDSILKVLNQAERDKLELLEFIANITHAGQIATLDARVKEAKLDSISNVILSMETEAYLQQDRAYKKKVLIGTTDRLVNNKFFLRTSGGYGEQNLLFNQYFSSEDLPVMDIRHLNTEFPGTINGVYPQRDPNSYIIEDNRITIVDHERFWNNFDYLIIWIT